MNDQNVVALKQPQPAPAFRSIDFRLSEDCSVIEVTLHGPAKGEVTFLEYELTSKSPETFDLDRWRAAWDRLRDEPETAA